jgi:dolichol kinase
MLEIRRKLVHASGIFTIFIILWLGKWNAALITLFAAAFMLILGEYRMNRDRYKIIRSKKIDEFEEIMEKGFKSYERPNTLPFVGAVEFYLGCFLAIVLFEPRTAMACISVLSLADAVSTLIGNYFGSHRLYINKKKTLEGSSAFYITALFTLMFFTDPLRAAAVALVATLAEALPRINDNITIPVSVGIFLTLIS